jgi:hypothetical protein
MKNILKYTSVLLTLGLIHTTAAQAVSFTYSEKTKKPAVIFNIRGGVPLPLNLSINGGLEIIPSYASIVGPNKTTNDFEHDFMGNIDLNLAYNFNLVNAQTPVGNFNPTLSPYVGYKHFFAYTPSINLATITNPSQSLSNTGGINYGLMFSTNVPLGFYVYADAGVTSMLNGSWSQWGGNNDSKGSIDSNGLILPHFGVGASWSFFNLLTLRAGYNMTFIPDIRTPSAPLTNDSRATVHSLDVGLSFLFFSI